MLVVVAREASNKKQNQRMVAMVISLVIVFTVCTGFQHVYFFIHEYGKMKFKLSTQVLLYALSNYVVSLQAAINPIIYGTLRRDFKKAFTHSLVIILIKLKLHKGLMLGEHNFASKVLTTYFSESHSKKHTNSDVKEVEELFHKKKLESEQAARRDSLYSCVDSPRIGERRPILNCDSPIINKGSKRDLSGSDEKRSDSPRVEGRHLIKSLGGHNTSFRESPMMAKKRFNARNDNSLTKTPTPNPYCQSIDKNQRLHVYFDDTIQAEDIYQQRTADIRKPKAVHENFSIDSPIHQLPKVIDDNPSKDENHLNNTDSPRVSRELSPESSPVLNRSTMDTNLTFSMSRSLGGKRLRKDSIFRTSTKQRDDKDNEAGVDLISYRNIRASTMMGSDQEERLTRNDYSEFPNESLKRSLLVSCEDNIAQDDFNGKCISELPNESLKRPLSALGENEIVDNGSTHTLLIRGDKFMQPSIIAPERVENTNTNSIGKHKFPSGVFIQKPAVVAAAVMPERRSPALQMVHKNLAERYRNNLYSVSDRGYVSGGSSGDDSTDEGENNRELFL